MRLGRLLAAIALSAAGVHAEPPRALEVRVEPERVCLDARKPAYLNFDLGIVNATGRSLKISQVRGLVLDSTGSVVERRILWSQALAQRGDTVPDGRETLVFNPFHFAARIDPRTVLRYEIDFDDASVGTRSVLVRPRACPTRTRLIFPYAGRSAILDGHDALAHHRLWDFAHPRLKAFGVVANTQRFALDIVAVDEKGLMFRGDGKRNEDWFAWGHPVRAPAAGRVVAMHDGQPDNDVIGDENRWTDRDFEKNETSSDGNFIVIDHGGGEMSLLAHLRNGSVKVRAGDTVRSGEVVAQAGNSGSSLGPHTHYELRDAPGVRGVHPKPARFRDVRIVGTGEMAGPEGIVIDTGDIVVAE
jgi:hypothetical protein